MSDGVDDFWGVVAALADNPAAVAQLLAEHQPDSDGLCRSCTRGGTGLRYVQWLCPVGRVALLADSRRRRQP